MIRLDKVDKYYNRHRRNQVHAIDNISLELENNGLVALLGPSGCGKTTLLNAIGGLDKIRKGKIYINDKKISTRCVHKKDKIRNINIGYIFQDYKLIDNMTVYQNVALVLIMLGVKNKKEIKTRVEYVLDKVGMLRYKRRPAAMLSGGERQRVGIARALVKNPDIILADEPTGNLDSKNSLEVMRIIKAISKDRLVILVTHESNLAHFYATRIIELQDGKIIKDYENSDIEDLDYREESNFYLKDFKYKNRLDKDNVDIDVYSNTKEKIKLDIVLKNGNIYIKSNTKDKVEVIEENSSIEFIDDHYKKIDKSEIDKLEFNFSDVIDNKYKKKYASILNPITLLIEGFKKVFDYSILKKILLIGFLVSGMFIMFSVARISSTLSVKDEDFIMTNPNYLIVKQNKIKVDDYISYEKLEGINYILPGDSIAKFSLKVNDYYQTNSMILTLSGSLSDIDMISEKDLILGKMPSNDREVVVDKLTIERFLKNSSETKMVGLTDYKSLLNRVLECSDFGEFKIVGISDLNNPSIYANKDNFINILYNSKEPYDQTNMVIDYNQYKNKISLVKGRTPDNDYEVVVGKEYEYEMPLNKEINTKVNDKKLVVVGYYTSAYRTDYYLVNNNTVKYNLINEKSDLVIYAKDKEKTINEFRDLNVNIKDSYTSDKNEYKDEIREGNRNTIIVSGIMLLISLVEMFLMSRSSFLSRIREIGILRAIGVKRIDIYKMFYGEIFAITTISSVPGIIFMAYALKTLSSVNYISRLFMINAFTVLTAIILVYVFNLLIGLVPVFNVLRKTPASILARHDLD